MLSQTIRLHLILGTNSCNSEDSISISALSGFVPALVGLQARFGLREPGIPIGLHPLNHDHTLSPSIFMKWRS